MDGAMSGKIEEKLNERILSIVDAVVEMFPVNLSGARMDDPFQALVAIILSQKTNTKNVQAAMKRFKKRFSSVEDVASASLKSIQDAIRPAGLWKTKARRIKLIARQLAEKGESLVDILTLPYEEAKMALSSLDGVGPKTADVFLMFVRGDPVLPIDTHIFRVMKRLGIASEKDGYEILRSKLESAVRPERRMLAHLALIEFGRKICKARNPICEECPFSRTCPSSRAT